MLRILSVLFLLLLLTTVFFCCEGLLLVMNQSCHTHNSGAPLPSTSPYRKVPHFRHTPFHKQHTHTSACPRCLSTRTQLPSQTASHHTASEDAIQHRFPHQDPGPGAWDGNRHLNTIGSWRPGCFLAVCFSEGRGGWLALSVIPSLSALTRFPCTRCPAERRRNFICCCPCCVFESRPLIDIEYVEKQRGPWHQYPK